LLLPQSAQRALRNQEKLCDLGVLCGENTSVHLTSLDGETIGAEVVDQARRKT